MSDKENLKVEMLIAAKNNLKNYEELLAVIKISNIENKEIRIQQCELCIKKQKQIISNLQHW